MVKQFCRLCENEPSLCADVYLRIVKNPFLLKSEDRVTRKDQKSLDLRL